MAARLVAAARPNAGNSRRHRIAAAPARMHRHHAERRWPAPRCRHARRHRTAWQHPSRRVSCRKSRRSRLAGNRSASAALPKCSALLAGRRMVRRVAPGGAETRRRRARFADCDLMISIGTSAVVYPAAAARSRWPAGQTCSRSIAIPRPCPSSHGHMDVARGAAASCPRSSRPHRPSEEGADDRPLRRGLPRASLGGAGALQHGGGLLHAARARPGAGGAAWEDEGGATATWTYHALQQHSNRLANALRMRSRVRRRGRMVPAAAARDGGRARRCCTVGACAMPLSMLFGPEALEVPACRTARRASCSSTPLRCPTCCPFAASCRTCVT